MLAINKKKMRVRDSCERLAAHGCAREVRACASMRVLSVALVAIAVTLFLQCYAYAEESGGGGGGHSFEVPNVGIIFYGPVAALDSNANQVNEVGVTAYNVYDAAAYVLGYSYGEVNQWSADIRAKLSNSSTGGSFWQFANTFTHTDNIDGVQWFIANIIYGSNLCWRSMYSDNLFRNALADCQTIINGGDVGGGTSGDDPDYFVYDVKTMRGYFPNVSKLYYPKTLFKFYSWDDISTIKSGYLGFTNVYPSDSSTGSIALSSYGFFTDANATYDMNDKNEYYKRMYVNSCYGGNGSVSGNCRYRLDGDRLYITSINREYSVSHSWISSNSFTIANDVYNVTCVFTGDSGGTPVVPPTNWPDEPSAPSPPELPEPSDPTVDPPEPYDPYDPVVDPPAPYNPTGGDTYIYNITNITDPTDTSSILEWVKKIFYELKALHSDLRTWVQNLGSALDKLRVTLNNGFTQLYGAIDDVESDIQDVVSAVDNANSQIYDRIGQLGTDLKSEFSSLKQYLRQLFNWLGEKMNFTAEGYDDTSVIYWLKRIWSKLGSGDINLRPTDPTSDPDNWWDWLVKAIQNFLIGLAATSTELISEIADLASQVMHEFPFSIPWDIAAVLAALSTAPITPVFTVTVPAIDGWWSDFDVVIDMHPFDGAAETIRLMEKLLFTGLLIWKSKELLDFMDVTKWFGS